MTTALSILAIVVSVISIVASWIQSIKQTQLQRDLTRETEALQERISKDESTAESRRFFAELWDKMKAVNHINVDDPASAVVRTNLNVMELMALCWQANIVDKRMMVLAFAKEYCSLYDELQQVSIKIKDLNRNGHELIADAPAITVLYNDFKTEHVKLGQM